MSDYIDVKIDIFEHADQRARVLESLTPAGLIQEILKEFDDITTDAPEKYAIYLKGMERPLNPASSMAELDIQPQDTLVFDYVRQAIRQMLEPKDYAFLREESTGKVYDIQWQPAVIGRPDSDVGHNIILAVNVQLLPDSMTVSRKHAQISFSEGHYFIEPLAEHNPVFLNNKEIPLNNKREIKNNDRLAVGRHKITMVFETQRATAARMEEPKSKVASRLPPTSPIPQSIGTPDDRTISAPATAVNPLTYLVVEASSTVEKVNQKIDINQYPFLLGRNIPLLGDEIEISRKHAEITYDPGRNKYFITDLKSTNGVSVEGVQIRQEMPTEIKAGYKIGLGKVVVLRFQG